MTSNLTSPDLNRITDEVSLLGHPSESPYVPYSPYHDSPEFSSNVYYQIPATEGYSFLESGVEPCVHRSPNQSWTLKETSVKRASTGSSKRSSPSHVQKDATELQRVGSSSEKNFDDHVVGTGERLTKPTTLSESKDWSDLAIVIAYLAFCLPFCCVLVYVAYLDGKPVNELWWNKIQPIKDALVNVYPIVFGLVLGQTTRKLAAWRLERGSSLLALEQLMGSLSLGSTLATHYALKALNPLGIGLLLVWVLSPLAGQATLHLLFVGGNPIVSSLNITFFNTAGTNPFEESGWTSLLPQINAIYASALFAPATVKTSATDLWGNVKVPDVARNGNSSTDGGWTGVGGPNTVYASLLGIPTSNVPLQGNTSFIITTAYASVSCTQKLEFLNDTSVEPPDSFPIRPNITASAINAPPPDEEFTAYYSPIYLGLDYSPDQYLTPGVSRVTNSSSNQSTLVAEIMNFEHQTYTVAYCPLSNALVDVNISCISSNCTAVAVRPSTKPHFPSNVVSFTYGEIWMYFALNLIEALGITKGDDTEGVESCSGSSATSWYLEDPYFSGRPITVQTYSDTTNVTKEDFAIRLQQVLNTYWQATLDGALNVTSISNPATSNYRPTNIDYTNGTTQVWQDVYRCNWGWYIVFVAATSVMTFAAVVSVVLEWRVKSPEVLGFCSSLVKDSKYIEISDNSALAATERSKVHKNLRLRLADVAGAGEIGHIAIVEVGSDFAGGEISPLRKSRKYR